MTNIVVTIKPDGKVVVDVQDGRGAQCVDLTKGIQNALGDTVQSMNKAEFYEPVDRLKVRTG